jgi:hypothetical protein
LNAKGQVDVELSEMRLPLGRDAARHVTAAGKLGFHEVTVGSSGLLKQVLGIVKLGERSIVVPDQQVALALKGGRFQQESMRVQVGKYELLASGSAGLDKTLSLLVELPLTKEVVGSDSAYELLKDEKLRVRVTGTLDEPKIDRDVVQENLRALLRGATGGLLRRILE